MSSQPVTDPTLGIAVDVDRTGEPPHRLVAIGDSVTQGFASGAVFRTDLSYPAIVAHELGWDGLRVPQYPGVGGLPLNIERLLRTLQDRFGVRFDWWEVPQALFALRGYMDEVEDHWERGAGSRNPAVAPPRHLLAVYGWDLRDALARTPDVALAAVRPPRDDLVNQLVSDHGARAALRVLPNLTPAQRAGTVFDAAVALGADGEPGIETLVVALGSNNALGAVTNLSFVWSGIGHDTLDGRDGFTVWRPEHFRAELALVAAQVARVRARHVVWCTVPHVTIAPFARGVGAKPPGSAYFDHYTRPWISDAEFDPRRHRHLTGAQARAVDTAVDAYNVDIVATVAQARRDGHDWYVCDLTTLLDRLAVRRFVDDPAARPPWWTPYPLPPALVALDPPPDVRFLTTGPDGRRATGGLFSLDGIHPTTVGYGLLAQELITVMERAGVVFRHADGSPRPGPVRVDVERLIRHDTLLTRPPGTVTSGLEILGWADDVAGVFGAALPF
ncbi:MAG: hypothetical protein ACT4RN_18120 [Pseudonocardia sp.]